MPKIYLGKFRLINPFLLIIQKENGPWPVWKNVGMQESKYCKPVIWETCKNVEILKIIQKAKPVWQSQWRQDFTSRMAHISYKQQADYTLASNLLELYEGSSLYIIKRIKYYFTQNTPEFVALPNYFFFFLIQLIAPCKYAIGSLREFFIESLTRENNSFPTEKSNSLPDVQAMHFYKKAKSRLLYCNLECSNLLCWNWHKIFSNSFLYNPYGFGVFSLWLKLW